MSTILTPPPTPSADRRRPLARLSDNPETRSVQIGVLGTILVHLLLFFLAPLIVRFETPPLRQPALEANQYSIELTPETLEKPAPQPPPSKFVETNPDAP